MTSRHILIGIVIAWLGLLIIFPLAGIIASAFENGFMPFLQSLDNPEFHRSFRLTFWITIIAVLTNVVMGIILALVISRQRFIGKMFVEELISLPLAVSPVVAGFMFIILFGKNGWMGSWFELQSIQIIYAIPGMIIATIFVTIPFIAKELIPVLRECGIDQEEAALTLGASRWQVFTRVTFPSIRWALAYGITLTTARALGEFGAVLVVSGNIIGKTQTATLYIHQEYIDFNLQGAFSASLVLAVISFCILMIMELLKKRTGTIKN